MADGRRSSAAHASSKRTGRRAEHGIYFADNGKIAWDVDTKGDYQTVNGVAAKGGSINGGGAVVVDGMLYVGSGSGIFGGTPGNVLLAYSVDGL